MFQGLGLHGCDPRDVGVIRRRGSGKMGVSRVLECCRDPSKLAFFVLNNTNWFWDLIFEDHIIFMNR